MGQESGNGLAEWFWVRASHETAVKLSAGAQSSESLTMGGG